MYNLGPMSREELQRAIAQPAAQMQVKLEPGLTDRLMQATWGYAGRLPLLEFAQNFAEKISLEDFLHLDDKTSEQKVNDRVPDYGRLRLVETDEI